MSTHNTQQTSTTQVIPSPDPQRSSATKPLMIVLAVLGGVTLLAIFLTTLFSSVVGLNRGSDTMTADTAGVTGVSVDSNAAQFTLEFGAVPEATLETSGQHASNWHLRRYGTELQVQAPNQWMNWCFFNCNFEDNQVILTLPEELNDGSLNADFDLAAGRLVANGDFNRLEVELGAGEATVNGAANELDAQISAGSANLNLANVQTAELEVAAGRMIAELTGSAPDAVNAEVSAGRLEVTLPDTEYAVNSQVSAGNLENQLQTSSASNHRVNVELSAGNATLRAGDTATQQ